MAESETYPAGELFLSPGLVLFLGRHVSTAPHRHFTASVTVSLEGPIRFRASESEPWCETQGFAARSNAALECDTGSELVVNFQLDPEKGDVTALEALDFGDGEIAPLPESIVVPLVEELRRLCAAPPFKGKGHALRRTVLNAICHHRPRRARTFDPRIARVLARLKDSVSDSIVSSAELAAEVDLSEGRLIHLFAEQLGVPLRRYVLALRLRRILFFLSVGQNLTDAAQEAGFCDSAHLTRVYREMYGLPPSKMFRSPNVRIRLERDETDPGPHAEHDRQIIERFSGRRWQSRDAQTKGAPANDARNTARAREARERDDSRVISSRAARADAPSTLVRSR
ncbi:MAG TPA: helix-turn-helix domain-containing protein [Polyangiales bacterium]